MAFFPITRRLGSFVGETGALRKNKVMRTWKFTGYNNDVADMHDMLLHRIRPSRGDSGRRGRA